MIDGLLKKRDAIYGFCALWIVLFHTFRRISMPYIPVVTNFVCLGNMAVDVFLFFSGLCLYLASEKHRYAEVGWGDYYRRRFSRVVLPYFIVGIPYFLWNSIAEHTGSALSGVLLFVANITSANFWLRGTQTVWFVYAIIAFYLLFPLIYRFVRKSAGTRCVLLVVVMALFAVATYYTPILKNSMIVWSRLPIFTIGVIAGKHAAKIRIPDGKKWVAVILSAVVVLALGFWISNNEIFGQGHIPQVYRLLLYVPMTLALLVIVSALPGQRFPLFSWLGGLSLEIYLVHITLLHPIKFYGMMDAVGYWLYLILPVMAIPIAFLVGKLADWILKKKQGG